MSFLKGNMKKVIIVSVVAVLVIGVVGCTSVKSAEPNNVVQTTQSSEDNIQEESSQEIIAEEDRVQADDKAQEDLVKTSKDLDEQVKEDEQEEEVNSAADVVETEVEEVNETEEIVEGDNKQVKKVAPDAEEKVEVSRTYIEDCGMDTGYWEIVYSDGSVEYIDE